jgi:hypothetical protein
MSSFRIYQINHPDPVKLGRTKRKQVFLYGGLSVIYFALLQFSVIIFQSNFNLVFFTLSPAILVIAIYFNKKLKSDLKQIKTIGDIEFTRSGIKKRIGDSLTEYEFTSIEKLELQRHIPAVTPRDSKSGYFSYILKIVFANDLTESLVVSDKPVDKRLDLSITDTLKTLKKIINTEIDIK